MKRQITPQYLSKLIDFGPDLGRTWSFDSSKEDMRNAQVKGAGHLFNLLSENNIALLADEVGMGKTIQALSVCAALWNQKPDARILVIAPREVVARNWEAEYQQFIKHHYRIADNIVKSETGDRPVNDMVYCRNLFELTQKIKLNWPRLLLAKTTSFSTLVSYSNAEKFLHAIGLQKVELSGNNFEKNEQVCRYLRRSLKLDRPVFDLMIIDEAHYFRNTHADTLRSQTAKLLFGVPDKDIPLAKSVLLMTATPNHTTQHDIKNIIGIFTNKYRDKDVLEVLKRICVRRLRRLSSKGVTKYGYRKEISLPADFESDPMGELFFGLYHYELVQKIEKENEGKASVSQTSNRIRSYLEATEFIPHDLDDVDSDTEFANEVDVEADGKTKKESREGEDFGSGDDRAILLNLSKRFKDIFNNKDPHHPKYDALTNELLQSCKGDKAVIFVRRIPSVYEINRRMITELDNQLWRKLKRLKGLENANGIPTRSKFREMLKEVNEEVEMIEEETEPENNDEPVKKVTTNNAEHIKRSQVLDFFILKKEKSGNRIKVDSTPAANFKLRFDPNKPSPFSLFFSPGPEYDEQPYHGMSLLRFKSGDKTIPIFYESALDHRLKHYFGWKDISKHFINRKKSLEGKEEILQDSIPTFFTLFWSIIKANPDEYRQLIETYQEMSVIEKEAVAKFVGEGLLSGSTFIVDMFITFTELSEKTTQEKPEAIKDYLIFCDMIKDLIRQPEIMRKVTEAILNFRQIYKKVFTIQSKADLFNEGWSDFFPMNIYPFSARNKNASILKTFNTPFFPDYLVATSVLQEGVNLQFFCDKLFHYGASWTPGDNEQRNGRIDRMFGLIERNLNSDMNPVTLNLYYPYLKNTVDEANLSNFFNKKVKVEKLIDEGIGVDSAIFNNQEEDPLRNWLSLLRTEPSDNTAEPYKVNMEAFNGISHHAVFEPKETFPKYVDSVKSILSSIENHKIEITSLGEGVYNGFVADPFLEHKEFNRRQPVIVEFIFDSIASSLKGETIFNIQMRTPIERSKMWRRVVHSELFRRIPPNVKLCIDDKAGKGNRWGLYLRTDTPLFTERKSRNPVSIDEIQASFLDLVSFADELERLLFATQDLSKKDLNLSDIVLQPLFNQSLLDKSKGYLQRHGWKPVGKYMCLNKGVELKNDNARFCLEMNHTVNHVQYKEASNGIDLTVALYSNDTTQVEYEILEEILQTANMDLVFKSSYWN